MRPATSRRKTVKETRGFIDRNLPPAVGAVPLSKLKASDLDRLYRRLQLACFLVLAAATAARRSELVVRWRDLDVADGVVSIERGVVMGPTGWSRRHEEHTQRALPGVRLHGLRHFVASQLLGVGVDVRTVAGRLGHRNAATTLNVSTPSSSSRPIAAPPT
jgi:integrase